MKAYPGYDGRPPPDGSMARAAEGVIPRRASLTTGRPGGSVLFMLFMQFGRLTLFAVDALSSLDTEEP